MSSLNSKSTQIILGTLFYVLCLGTGLALLAGVYYAGAFSASFSLNLCYSESLRTLAIAADDTLKSQDADRAKAYVEMIKNLPLHGYETNCDEVKNMIAKFAAKH